MSQQDNAFYKLQQAQIATQNGRHLEAVTLYQEAMQQNPELAKKGLGISLAHNLILSIDWKQVSNNLPPEINYLDSSGWLESIKQGKPVNKEGKPIPWYTYPAIEFIEDKLSQDLVVFEYGAGNSTLWLAERVKSVVSVESDSNWFNTIRSQMPDNVEINLIQDPENYAKKIEEYPNNYFDLIIVDGINRNQCAEKAISRLKNTGFIIFDNTDNWEHNQGNLSLLEAGFKQIDFYGMIPSYTYKNCTSIFYQNEYLFNRGDFPSDKKSCLGKSCFQVTKPKNREPIQNKETNIDKQANSKNIPKIDDKKTIISHHFPSKAQRDIIFSKNEIYLTSSQKTSDREINFPLGSNINMEDIVKQLPPNWYPDLFVAKVDSFFNIIPRNVEALSCPKILILGDTQHGINPLNRMINYAKSEQYDFYITDHKRHHLWYYWLAGLDNLYWLPGLFINPPAYNFKQQLFQTSGYSKDMFLGKTFFIGQAGKYHPRRKKLINYLKQNVSQFGSAQLPQADSYKVYNLANIALNISLNGDLNLRNFEILASEGFLLTDKLSEESGIDLLLEAGKEYEFFTNKEDLVDKINYYSKHTQEAKKIRQQGYLRYCQEYQPKHLLNYLNQLIHGQTLEKRFTVNSIKRIQYYSGQRQISNGRIHLYQYIQDIHRQWESVEIWLDAQMRLASLLDYLDLPRVKVTVTNFNQKDLASFSPYLENSSDSERVSLNQKTMPFDGFNVIITSQLTYQFLSKLLDLSQDDKIIISNDFSGLNDILDYSRIGSFVSINYCKNYFFILSVIPNKKAISALTLNQTSYSLQKLKENSEQQKIDSRLNLRAINLIIFPNWNASEEMLLPQLENALKTISSHPKVGKITLLLDLQGVSEEDANMALSSAVMNLMMEEGIELREDLEVSPVPEISDREWEILLSNVQGRIMLDNESNNRVKAIGADQLPAYNLETLSKETFIPKAEQEAISEQFNLRDINLIICPNWNKSEDTLLQDLANALKTVSQHPEASQITLLLDLQGISQEDADLALSSAVMNLMMEEGIELSEDLEVSPVPEISDRAWEVLLSKINGRIILETEERDRVTEIGAEKLPAYTLESLTREILDEN